MTDQPEPEDTCQPVEVDGETIRVRGSGDLTDEGTEALAALVRVAKAKFVADAPEKVGELQGKLRLAHKARRAKEHQLDDIRRALCDIGFMEDDDPYSHADLADVIRQNGPAATEATEPVVSIHGKRDLTPDAREALDALIGVAKRAATYGQGDFALTGEQPRTTANNLREQLAAAVSPVLHEHPEHNTYDQHDAAVSDVLDAVLAVVLPTDGQAGCRCHNIDELCSGCRRCPDICQGCDGPEYQTDDQTKEQ